MKRLFFILLLLFAVKISAQTEFVIGDSNTTQNTTLAPLICDNKYSYSQSLYKSNELMVGSLTSISYYHIGGWFNAGVVKIYLKETTQSTLTSFVSLQNSVEVFSDTVFLANGWVTFEFSTPYEYSGNNNLVITMIKEGFTTQNNHFFKSRDALSSTISVANHTNPYNITTPNSAYSHLINQTPIVKIEINPDEEYCYQPFNLRVDSVSTDFAIISWDNFWQEETFVGIAYKKNTEEDWIIVEEGVTDTTYEITGLESHTNYKIKLWTICPFSESSEQIVSLTTITHPDDCIPLPYYNDFDNLEDLSKWSFTHFGENQ